MRELGLVGGRRWKLDELVLEMGLRGFATVDGVHGRYLIR